MSTADPAASPTPHIAVVLPPKERFAAHGAGAVSICVRDTVRASRLQSRMTVFGMPEPEPFEGVHYQAIRPGVAQLLGRNTGFARAAARQLDPARTRLVEVHNRAPMAHILQRAGSWKVALHIHNDPQTMGGLESISDRQRTLDRLDAVVCVSDFVRDQYLDGVADPAGKVRRIYNGVVIKPPGPQPRANEILFVGRFVADKGVHHLAEALEQVLPLYPEWRARLIGASWFGRKRQSAFERAVAKRLAPFGERVVFEGFRHHNHSRDAMGRAAILVVPTLMPEAFGLVAAEGMVAGCAVIAYPNGGLKEICRDRAVITDAQTPSSLAVALKRLIDEPEVRMHYQAAGPQAFPYAIERAAGELDAWRESLLSSPS